MEQERNDWVAAQLTVPVDYRDDNVFMGMDGREIGSIILIEGVEHLVDHNSEGEVAVPFHLRLGL